jgi:hypothetical protein
MNTEKLTVKLLQALEENNQSKLQEDEFDYEYAISEFEDMIFDIKTITMFTKGEIDLETAIKRLDLKNWVLEEHGLK